MILRSLKERSLLKRMAKLDAGSYGQHQRHQLVNSARKVFRLSELAAYDVAERKKAAFTEFLPYATIKRVPVDLTHNLHYGYASPILQKGLADKTGTLSEYIFVKDTFYPAATGIILKGSLPYKKGMEAVFVSDTFLQVADIIGYSVTLPEMVPAVFQEKTYFVGSVKKQIPGWSENAFGQACLTWLENAFSAVRSQDEPYLLAAVRKVSEYVSGALYINFGESANSNWDVVMFDVSMWAADGKNSHCEEALSIIRGLQEHHKEYPSQTLWRDC